MTKPLEGHIVQCYDGELNQLHMLMLEMSNLVLKQVEETLEVLGNKDLVSTQRIIARDQEVDAFELKIDKEIVSLIARRGPVAKDLRLIMAFSKAVTDLERIGDESSRIAHLIEHIYDNEANDPSIYLLHDIHTIGKMALGMLNEAVSVIYTLDAQRAAALLGHHGDLDVEFRSAMRCLSTFVLEDARNVGHSVQIILILKALERIGDHSRNLAEYIIFFSKGEDVRHQDAAAHALGRSLEND